MRRWHIINIRFRNNKVKKLCTNYSAAQKALNVDVAERLHALINIIQNAQNINDICAIGRYNFHALKANRLGQYALDRGRRSGWRLIVTPLDEDDHEIEISEERFFTDASLVILIREVSNHYD